MLKRIALGGIFMLAFAFSAQAEPTQSSKGSSAKSSEVKKAPTQPAPQGFCYPPGSHC
jgi:hypothetical protein